MKNRNIHSGLDQKEIRDFISISLMRIFKQECELKKETIPYDKNNPYDWGVKDTEAIIQFQQNHLILLKEKIAIFQIMKMCGWKEYDISDYTPKDIEYNNWMSFIGTEDEYKIILKILKTN